MPSLSTPLCESLGIDVPIIQAPIGSASCPALAAAVSNAGGLGTLAVTWLDPEATRAAVRATMDATDRPFAVNLVVDENARAFPPEEHVAVCLEEGIELFSFSFGDATEYAEAVHDAGGSVLWTVGSEREADEALAAGADVLVAQGWEAGGHVQGEVATMPLVPAVVDRAASRSVPVVAAGGIGDGRGIAAVLALGADGAWLGTRFVATEEAAAHHLYRDRVTEATVDETVYTEVFDREWPGTPHRTLVNSTVEDWRSAGRPPAGERPGEHDELADRPDGPPVERYSDVPPTPEMHGDVEALALYAGQSVGQITAVRSAASVVTELVDEACNEIERLGGLVEP